MVGRGVLVQLGEVAFLRTNGGGEVAEVVCGQRDVGVEGFADGLAVVPRFSDREELNILVNTVGDLVQDGCAFRGRRLAP
ncbi:hypothetical protein D3C73_1517630 [compost metagenome]